MVFVNPETTGQALEILLIEDGLLDAKITVESLKNCGIHHRVTLFRDGAESLDFLNRKGCYANAPKPDVILLDLFLPDTQGIDLLRLFRSIPDLSTVPVVILTSSDDDADRSECEKLGVSSYIRKPFNEDKFLSVIRRIKGLSLSVETPSPA